MTAVLDLDNQLEVVDAEFFAPVSSDVIDTLIGRHDAERRCILEAHRVITSPEFAGAVQYFLTGNSKPDRGYSMATVESMFALEPALFQLRSRYWAEALSLTDVYDCMPQARRDEWNAMLKGEQFAKQPTSRWDWENTPKLPKLPEFDEGTVRATLRGLLAQRTKFFAERIDGIFRGLSGEHVTNAPEAFGKRMIIGNILIYGAIRHEKAGLINDLRAVIAKFMGRDEPKYNATDVALRDMYANTGEWVKLDAGALRIRVYKKGTAHIEVHPDMAWRLNQVLASLYPLAIPSEFRQKPKKRPKDFVMMGRPLPFATIELLAAGLTTGSRRAEGDNRFTFYYDADKKSAAYAEACTVLAAIGGTPGKDGWMFDYRPFDAIREIVKTGCLPDQRAHQFYPTPEDLAAEVVQLADIGPGHSVLEPSAGQGALAELLPPDRTTCVEISPLHCAILKSKGLNVIGGDFLMYADHMWPNAPFDRIVMNPPFSDGRAKLHTEYASRLLKPGGVLVAVLPSVLRGKHFLGLGFTCEWGPVLHDKFPGASVAVSILKAVRA